MQGYQQPPQAAPVHPSMQAIHTVLPPPQQPNVFSRPEVIASRRIGQTAVIVSVILILSVKILFIQIIVIWHDVIHSVGT